MDASLYYLVPSFLIISFLYSIVAQGGASGYLAIMALAGISYQKMPIIALCCGIVSTASSVYTFYRAGYLNLGLTLPFLVTALPASFIAATFNAPEALFTSLLIIILVISALRIMVWRPHLNEVHPPSIKTLWIAAPLIGIVLGVVVGIVGIGGGILIFPVIIMLGWADVKEAATAGGFFTLVNSLSGVLGQSTKGEVAFALILPLAIASLVGSYLGSRLGARRLPVRTIQWVFAIILLLVSLRLAVKLFFRF